MSDKMVFIHVIWTQFGDKRLELIGPIPEKSVNGIANAIFRGQSAWRWWSQEGIDPGFEPIAFTSQKNYSPPSEE